MKKEIHVGYWNEQCRKDITKIIKKYGLEDAFDRSTKSLESSVKKGDKIPRPQWPKKYKKMKRINNLWRYDLVRKHPGWRLIYTVLPDGKIRILAALLEVLDHHEYDRLFRY